MTNDCSLTVNTVIVNPETKRHVRLVNQVNNCTTTNVGVLIGMSRIEQDTNNTCERISSNVINTVAVANNNGEERVEHSVNEWIKDEWGAAPLLL